MSNNHLLDTNAAIARIRKDADLETLIGSADPICVPVIVLGELFYGAENSQRVEENIRQIEELIANTVVLDCDTGTAREFGKIARPAAQRPPDTGKRHRDRRAGAAAQPGAGHASRTL